MQQDDYIKVGFISGFTGEHREWTKSQYMGAQLAAEELNEAGGVLGRRLKLLMRDDAMSSPRAAAHAAELIKEEKVDALMCTLSAGTVLDVNREAVKNDVPFMAICQAKIMTDAAHLGRYSFHESLTPHMCAQLITKWGTEHLGKRWSFLAYDFPFGRDCVAAFHEVFARSGAEIVSTHFVPVDSTPDVYEKEFAKILAEKPDVLSVTTIGPDQVNFMIAAHRARLIRDVSVVHTLSDLSIVDHVPLSNLVGMYWGVNFYWGLAEKLASAKKFVERYRERFHAYPTGYSGYGYSGMLELAAAMEAGGKYPLDKDAMQDFLEGRSYDHYKGRQWWRPCDHQSFQDFYVLRFKGPEESQHHYDIGEIIGTVSWDLNIERTCEELGHDGKQSGHGGKKTT